MIKKYKGIRYEIINLMSEYHGKVFYGGEIKRLTDFSMSNLKGKIFSYIDWLKLQEKRLDKVFNFV